MITKEVAQLQQQLSEIHKELDTICARLRGCAKELVSYVDQVDEEKKKQNHLITNPTASLLGDGIRELYTKLIETKIVRNRIAHELTEASGE